MNSQPLRAELYETERPSSKCCHLRKLGLTSAGLVAVLCLSACGNEKASLKTPPTIAGQNTTITSSSTILDPTQASSKVETEVSSLDSQLSEIDNQLNQLDNNDNQGE